MGLISSRSSTSAASNPSPCSTCRSLVSGCCAGTTMNLADHAPLTVRQNTPLRKPASGSALRRRGEAPPGWFHCSLTGTVEQRVVPARTLRATCRVRVRISCVSDPELLGLSLCAGAGGVWRELHLDVDPGTVGEATRDHRARALPNSSNRSALLGCRVIAERW